MTETTAGKTGETHALVLGGSMAGLFAARVLSDHFDRVTLVERDALPETPDFRGGAPQARHVHVLLERGQRSMESLFPGLTDDFARQGAPRVQWGTGTASLVGGGWTRRFRSGHETNQISRSLLEYLIRGHVQRCGNVTILAETDVLGLCASPDGSAVIGAQVQSRRQRGDATSVIEADLVVDATGRGSKSPEWLTALGYEAPPESTVYAYIGYATRWYQMPKDKPDWQTLLVNSVPREGIRRGGVILEVEGDRWIVTLGGMNRDYPPTDEPGFMEYARSLASPVLAEALEQATPISPIYGYRYDGNRLRHYEKLTRRPENYIVLGDALCGFNPIYGQGMTVCCLEAIELGRLLGGIGGRPNRARLVGFAATFQAAVARLLRSPWLMATGEDLRYPETEGTRPGGVTRLLMRYLDRVLRAVPHDNQVSLAFIETFNLTRPPTALLSPRIALRVLRDAFRPADGPAKRHRIPPVEAG